MPLKHEVMWLKASYPDFVRNSARMLELMLPPHCKRVTDACPARDNVLPLYLDGDHFTTPFCCYGNDVDCERCGAWVVFHLAVESMPPLMASNILSFVVASFFSFMKLRNRSSMIFFV